MRRREVHCNTLPNLANDELVRVVTGGNVVDVVDVAQRDDLCRFARKQVGYWQRLRCGNPDMTLSDSHGDGDSHRMRMPHRHLLEIFTDLGFKTHYKGMRNVSGTDGMGTYRHNQATLR